MGRTGQAVGSGKRRTGKAGETAGGGNQGVERAIGGWNFLKCCSRVAGKFFIPLVAFCAEDFIVRSFQEQIYDQDPGSCVPFFKGFEPQPGFLLRGAGFAPAF